MSFPLFGIGWKIQGMENPGEKFLSRANQFFPPKSGGKSREENWAEWSFTRMPSIDPFNSRLSPTPLKTFVQITYHLFSSSSLYLPSTPSTVPGSLLSLFFFFLFSFYVHEPLKQCLCKLIINFILFHKINLIFFPDSFEQIECNLEKLIKITFKLLH